eukprot:scaffold155174_cov33-Tisochrysis_lutea.AAC.3
MNEDNDSELSDEVGGTGVLVSVRRMLCSCLTPWPSCTSFALHGRTLQEDPAKLAIETGSLSPRKGPTAPGTPGLHPGTPRRGGIGSHSAVPAMAMGLSDAIKEAVHQEEVRCIAMASVRSGSSQPRQCSFALRQMLVRIGAAGSVPKCTLHRAKCFSCGLRNDLT